MKKFILGLSVLTLGLFSCDEEVVTPEVEAERATVSLKIEHHFNGVKVNLTDDFVTANNDTINFSEFKYFLSNLTLGAEGKEDVTPTDSYYLIDLADGAIQYEKIENLDPADFSSLKISVGVDSVANHSVVNGSGDLDPAGADGMIWAWATGFKFIRTEGSYKNGEATGDFVLHLGGDANYKTFHFGGSSHGGDHEHGATGGLSINLAEGSETEVHLMVNLAELFVSPNAVDLDNVGSVHSAGSLLLENIKESEIEGTNGWFQLHHVSTTKL